MDRCLKPIFVEKLQALPECNDHVLRSLPLLPAANVVCYLGEVWNLSFTERKKLLGLQILNKQNRWLLWCAQRVISWVSLLVFPKPSDWHVVTFYTDACLHCSQKPVKFLSLVSFTHRSSVGWNIMCHVNPHPPQKVSFSHAILAVGFLLPF